MWPSTIYKIYKIQDILNIQKQKTHPKTYRKNTFLNKNLKSENLKACVLLFLVQIKGWDGLYVPFQGNGFLVEKHNLFA